MMVNPLSGIKKSIEIKRLLGGFVRWFVQRPLGASSFSRLFRDFALILRLL